MRVAVLRPGPAFSVADVCRGWVNAFLRLGVQTVDLNFDERLTYYDRAEKALGVRDDQERYGAAVRLASHSVRADLFDLNPDVVVVVSGFYIPHDWYSIVRGRGVKVVLLCTESPYEDDRQLQRAPLVDIVILNDPTNLDEFRAVNPHTHYFPHAYDPQLHTPGDPDPDILSDFCFVGTGYPSRIEFFEAVDWTGVDCALAGNWQWVKDDSPLIPFLVNEREHCLDNSDAVRLYRSTKVAANLYRKEATEAATADGWAMGPREVELAACGTFFLREPRGESDEVFGTSAPTFSSVEEFADLLRFYLARPDLRVLHAEAARRKVADRTFENSARRLLSLI